MTIFLCVTAWIVAGLAAAYIGHHWVDELYHDTHMGELLLIIAFAPLCLTAVLFMLGVQIRYAKFFRLVVFKSRYDKRDYS